MKCELLTFLGAENRIFGFLNVEASYDHFSMGYLTFSLVEKKRQNLYFSNLMLFFIKMAEKVVKNHDLLPKMGQNRLQI